VAGWTQRGRLTVLSAIFTYAIRHLDYAGTNPVSVLDRHDLSGVGDQGEPRVLTGEETDAILAGCPAPPGRVGRARRVVRPARC